MSRLALLIGVAGLAACGGTDGGKTLSVDELQDPSTCMQCHPNHHDEWSGSMHAYASDDPVFVAMNKRGQRETNNALGTFCVKCHAPMAVELGETNGVDFDPAALRPQTRGITCYFCHTVKDVSDTHNNGLVLEADSVTMRGGFQNPVANSAHHAEYDKTMDSDVNNSELCGSCHDVVTPRGVALERSYTEWQTTFFSDASNPHTHLTCGACHMPSRTDVIADDPTASVPQRTNGFHSHLWPGIDQAMTPWPNTAGMAAAIKDILDPALAIIGPKPLAGTAPGGICVNPNGTITVRMDSFGTGHSWPSGAAQDRRAWLEVIAYKADNTVVFQSGTVADGVDPIDPADAGAPDPNLFGLWDRTVQDNGMPAHFFWDVAPDGVTSKLLRPPVTLLATDPRFDHSSTATFPIGNTSVIDRVEARIRIRPFALSVIAQLVSSGDLDASFMTKVPTLSVLGTTREWTRATAGTGAAINTPCNPF